MIGEGGGGEAGQVIGEEGGGSVRQVIGEGGGRSVREVIGEEVGEGREMGDRGEGEKGDNKSALDEKWEEVKIVISDILRVLLFPLSLFPSSSSPFPFPPLPSPFPLFYSCRRQCTRWVTTSE